MISCTLARTAEANVRPRVWHSRTSKAGLARLYSMNFISTKPLWETIGNAAVERGLEAFDGALLRGHVGLQEGGVRVLLHLQQVRHFEHAVAFAEALADALAFGIGIGHEISGL
jgi:hypothetical protein